MTFSRYKLHKRQEEEEDWIMIKPATVTKQLSFSSSKSENEIHYHPAVAEHKRSDEQKSDVIDNNQYNTSSSKSNKSHVSTSSAIRPPKAKQLHDIMMLHKQLNSSDDNTIKHIPNTHLGSNVVFIINNKWYQEWKSYCEDPTDTLSSPGPIDNTSLIDYILPSEVQSPSTSDKSNKNESNGHTKCTLKPDLKENIDYIPLSIDQWKALVCWYQGQSGGGPPIPRLIYPSTIQHHLSPPDHPHTYSTVGMSTEDDTIQSPVAESTSYVIDLYTPNPPSMTDIESLLNNIHTTTVTRNNSINNINENKPTIITTSKTTINPNDGHCYVCGKTCFTRCTKCLAIKYCSVDCQRVSILIYIYT